MLALASALQTTASPPVRPTGGYNEWLSSAARRTAASTSPPFRQAFVGGDPPDMNKRRRETTSALVTDLLGYQDSNLD